MVIQAKAVLLLGRRDLQTIGAAAEADTIAPVVGEC